jgi:TolA-binding protein
MDTTTIFTALFTAAAVLGATGLQLVAQGIRGLRRGGLPSFSDRVEQAVRALRDATGVVQELEREIDAKRQAVERLQDQHELLRLDESEIEAVSHLLQDDARSEGRRAIVISLVSSALFFLAGIGVTLLAT